MAKIAHLEKPRQNVKGTCWSLLYLVKCASREVTRFVKKCKFTIKHKHLFPLVITNRYNVNVSKQCQTQIKQLLKEHSKSGSILFVILSIPQTHAILLFFCLIWFDSLHPSQQFISYVGTALPWLNQYLARINVSCSRTQCSDASEAQTHSPSVSSQALYYWTTALPPFCCKME